MSKGADQTIKEFVSLDSQHFIDEKCQELS